MGFWRNLLDSLFGSKGPKSSTVAPSQKEQKVVVLSDEEMALVRKYGHDGLATAASSLAEAGRFKESFLCSHIMAKTHPQGAAFWRQCGTALYQMDESEWRKQRPGLLPTDNAQQSLTYFDKALELDKSDHLTWYFKGLCLATLGSIQRDKPRMKQGLECLDQAVLLSNGDARIRQAKEQYERVYTAM